MGSASPAVSVIRAPVTFVPAYLGHDVLFFPGGAGSKPLGLGESVGHPSRYQVMRQASSRQSADLRYQRGRSTHAVNTRCRGARWAPCRARASTLATALRFPCTKSAGWTLTCHRAIVKREPTCQFRSAYDRAGAGCPAARFPTTGRPGSTSPPPHRAAEAPTSPPVVPAARHPWRRWFLFRRRAVSRGV